MGYTHYWEQEKDFSNEEWEDIVKVCGKLRLIGVEADVQVDRYLEDGYGENIWVEGLTEATRHEIFFIPKKVSKDDWRFCKTARKPYDTTVVALLMFIKFRCPWFEWSSDGDKDDHALGLELFNKIKRI